ncbi:hypothetical protein F2Q69_00034586 [Brassica cretica]|uniref:Uncharacterized protein n=1 Tax=Brassica cretica TaxID=69181 RepID=A0A8S9SIY6_BRACR|nr:hypothetical protein F2Q69_00034586 [Brassica cretica]
MVSNKARISGTLLSHLVLKRPCKCLMVWWLLNLDTRCVPSANLSWNEVVSAAVSTKALLVVLVLRSFVWVNDRLIGTEGTGSPDNIREAPVKLVGAVLDGSTGLSTADNLVCLKSASTPS